MGSCGRPTGQQAPGASSPLAEFCPANIVMTYAGKVPDTDLTLCRLRARPEYLTERVFRRGLGRGPVIPGPPASKSRRLLAGTAAEAIREARELDAADFADLCVDTDDYTVRQLARLSRGRDHVTASMTSTGRQPTWNPGDPCRRNLP